MTSGDAVPGRARPVLSVVPGDQPDSALDVDQLGSRIVGLAGRLASGRRRGYDPWAA